MIPTAVPRRYGLKLLSPICALRTRTLATVRNLVYAEMLAYVSSLPINQLARQRKSGNIVGHRTVRAIVQELCAIGKPHRQ